MLVCKCIASAEVLGRVTLPESHWLLAAAVCWPASTFGAELGLSLKVQHPSSLGGNEQKALGEDCLCPQTLPGVGMKMQLNDSSLFPAAPFLRKCDSGEGSGAGRAEDRLMDSVSVILPLCCLRMPNSLQQSFLAGFGGISPASPAPEAALAGRNGCSAGWGSLPSPN